MTVRALPAEIWREVILAAVLPRVPVPSSLLSSEQAASERLPSLFGWQPAPPRTKDTLHLLNCLCLVSRTLWSTTCEFLYDALILRTASASENLAHGMQLRLKQFDSGIGVWTTRILIEPAIVDNGLIMAFTASVKTVIQCCPNLQTVIINRHPAWEPLSKHTRVWGKHIGDILRVIPPSISHLEYECSDSDWEKLSKLLERCSSLQALRLTGSIARSADLSPLTLPSLSLLYISRKSGLNDGRVFSRWQMSSLTHLFVTGLFTDSHSDPFWDMAKPALVFLHLGWRTMLNPQQASKVLQGLPNLRILEFHYLYPWGNVWNAEDMPRSLCHLSVKLSRTLRTGAPSSAFDPEQNPNYELDWALFQEHITPFIDPRRPLLKTLKFVIHPSTTPRHRLLILSMIEKYRHNEVEILIFEML